MRARGMMMAAMIAAIGTSCSSESTPPGDTDMDANQPRTLSLPDETPAGDAVVSDLESGTAPQIAPVGSAAASSQEDARPDPRGSQQVATALTIPDVSASVVSTSRAPLAVPEITVERRQPAEATVGTEADEPSPTAGRGDDSPAGPRVMIRGGVTENDDCKIHVSPPRVGVLINQRGPRLGLPSIRGGGIR